MVKRTTHKKLPLQLRTKHSISHYIRLYFLSLFVATLLFVSCNFIFKPKPPCANSQTCTSDLSTHIQNGADGIFQGQIFKAPLITDAFNSTRPSVLGTATPSADKHIYVDLATQTLYAYQGSTKILQTLVATGRWNPTPVGNFHVWEKLVSTRMAGGEGSDAYDLPNVPYVMYFYNDFGLHGAYWHDNFGHTMSHGCVNLRQVDAQALYNWADGPTNGQPGTAVSICNHFSKPGTCEQVNPIND